jgi:hypothetical protein
MMRVLVLAIAFSTTLCGCAPRAEEPILAAFFHASRLRDRTALQKLATASFDPAVEGIITSFVITGVAVRNDGGGPRKDVAIAAPVKLMTGRVVQKHLVVTIQQHDGAWLVTAVTEQPASAPSTPPS